MTAEEILKNKKMFESLMQISEQEKHELEMRKTAVKEGIQSSEGLNKKELKALLKENNIPEKNYFIGKNPKIFYVIPKMPSGIDSVEINGKQYEVKKNMVILGKKKYRLDIGNKELKGLFKEGKYQFVKNGDKIKVKVKNDTFKAPDGKKIFYQAIYINGKKYKFNSKLKSFYPNDGKGKTYTLKDIPLEIDKIKIDKIITKKEKLLTKLRILLISYTETPIDKEELFVLSRKNNKDIMSITSKSKIPIVIINRKINDEFFANNKSETSTSYDIPYKVGNQTFIFVKNDMNRILLEENTGANFETRSTKLTSPRFSNNNSNGPDVDIDTMPTLN